MARRSVHVLRAHPKLVVFPLAGGLAGVAFLATLFGVLYVTGSHLEDPGPVVYGTLFVAYAVETFVASFFSAALIAATRTVFQGEEPSIRGAMADAWKRKLPLLVWSLAAAFVGMVIRSLEESQNNVVGDLLANLFSVAWGVMTFFIVPVIVFRDPSVTEMFKESAGTFKDTWGESLGATSAIGFVTLLLALFGIGVGIVTFFVTAGLGSLQILATVLIGGSTLVFGLLIGTALSGVAKTALYVYATDDTTPKYFQDMDFGQLGGSKAASASSASGQV